MNEMEMVAASIQPKQKEFHSYTQRENRDFIRSGITRKQYQMTSINKQI